METRRIAVVGGGTMGNGIAHICAVADIRVRLVDVSSQVLDPRWRPSAATSIAR